MALRLSLVIDGDAAGAKKALADTRKEIGGLRKEADELNKVAVITRPPEKFEWNTREVEEARLGLKGVGEEARGAAGGLTEVSAAAPSTAANIGGVGDAAEKASGKVGGLKALLAGAVFGIGAGIAAQAVGAGLEAAAGAAGDLAREIFSNTPAIERDLKSHRQLVGEIRTAYNEAQGAASSYGNASSAVLTFSAQQDAARLKRDLQNELAMLRLGGNTAGLSQELDIAATLGNISPVADKVRELVDAFQAGKTDVIAFRDALAGIGKDLPEESGLRERVGAILEETKRAGDLLEELRRSQDLIKAIPGDAEAAQRALGGAADKYTAVGSEAAGAAPGVESSTQAIERSGAAAAAAAGQLSQYAAAARAAGAAGGSDLATQSGLPAGGFASGGYTGDGGAAEPAGVVHGQEFVVNARATRRHRSLLEAINAGLPGYASGGYVQGRGAEDGGYAYGYFGGLAGEVNVLTGTLRQFGQTLIQTGSASQALESVFNSVTQKLIDKALALLDQLVFGSGGGGGLLGSIFGIGSGLLGGSSLPGLTGSGNLTVPWNPNILHAGGRVSAVTASRSVPAGLFAGAPRLHTGGWLKPGERPIIAMDGEEVGWPSQLAAKYGGQAGNLSIEVRLSPELEARILSQAQSMSVSIVQANERARQDRYRNGGNF